MEKSINLFWTGGLDSTFRLVELSRENVEIQPYYIVDQTRGSISYEKKAMSKIYNLLMAKTQTKATLKNIKFVKMNDIKPDKEITDSWKCFKKSHALGSQYDYLARFAKQNNLILEIGLENSPRSKASTVLTEFGDLSIDYYTEDKTLWGEILKISENTVCKECLEIFKHLRFSKHLFSIEKVEEAKLLTEWGCDDILQATWFCHRPVFGIPCGQCNPCKDALNEGMEWRVPLKGRILGKIRDTLVFPLRGLRKIYRIVID